MPLGAILCTYCRSWDFAVEGSPQSKILISPLKRPLPVEWNSLLTPPKSWVSDLALLNETAFFHLTAFTSKGCLFHLRNDIAATNDDTSKSNELFYVSWVKFSDSVDLSQIERSYLN